MAGLTIGKANGSNASISIGKPANSNASISIGQAPSGNVSLGTAPQYDTIMGDGTNGVVATFVRRADGSVVPAPTNNATVSGGGGSTVSRAQVDPLLQSLSSLDTILTNKNASAQDEYGRAIQGYDASDALDRTNYDQNTSQNETSLTSNNQKALLNAANASSGLRGVLASLHALGGSGVDIVKRLVGLAANQDTGAARDTFETNAKSLTQAWGQTEQEQRQRRADADALLKNNLNNNEADVLTSRQSILQQLANTYGAGTAEGARYAGEAGALAAPLARTTRSTVAPYQAASSLFSPAALQSYLGGTQNLNVATSGGGDTIAPINSPIYAQKKDQLSGVA